jgi:hypothetical protein
MTRGEFQDFFGGTLQSVPGSDRDRIVNYWKRFRVQPIHFLDNATIDRIFGPRVKVAAVSGFTCLNAFAFRQFLHEKAPQNIIRSVILHELAHCRIRSNDTRELQERSELMRLIQPPFHNPLSQALRRYDEIIEYFREEGEASSLCSLWGGDDKEAWKWCDQFWKAGQT